MEPFAWLAAWYNWPFLFALAVGVIFILLDLALGGVSHSLDADAGADVGHDLGHDLGHDASHELDHDHTIDPDHAAAGIGHALLTGVAWVGLGKVPLTLLMEVLLLSFGGIGFLLNALLTDLISIGPPLLFVPNLCVSGVGAVLFTRFVGGFIAKHVPADSTMTTKPGGFTGEVGTVSMLTTVYAGQVHLEATEKRPAVDLNARVDPTAPRELARGVSVLLTYYDPSTNVYLIAPTALE